MSSPSAHDVAAAIRAQAARKRISQTELAEAAGISQATMSRRLQGSYPFTVDEIFRLAEVLEIDAATLIKASA